MYKGEIICADFETSTIEFMIDGDFSVRAGEYYILDQKEYDQLQIGNLKNIAHDEAQEGFYYWIKRTYSEEWEIAKTTLRNDGKLWFLLTDGSDIPCGNVCAFYTNPISNPNSI